LEDELDDTIDELVINELDDKTLLCAAALESGIGSRVALLTAILDALAARLEDKELTVRELCVAELTAAELSAEDLTDDLAEDFDDTEEEEGTGSFFTGALLLLPPPHALSTMVSDKADKTFSEYILIFSMIILLG